MTGSEADQCQADLNRLIDLADRGWVDSAQALDEPLTIDCADVVESNG